MSSENPTFKMDEDYLTWFWGNTSWVPCIYPELDHCQIWQGRTWKDSKGRISYGCVTPYKNSSKREKAHRFSFFLRNGYFPKNGLLVRHKCDTKLCVNPDHLEVGTHMENVADYHSRGKLGLGVPPPHDGSTESSIETVEVKEEPKVTVSTKREGSGRRQVSLLTQPYP